MYGIVNLAIEDLIVQEHGENAWADIASNAGLGDVVTFVTTENYPDELTYQLVQSACQYLDAEPQAILRAFGSHWITYTRDHGFGELLQVAGNSFGEFVRNINSMHAQVAAILPGAETPTIDVEDLPDGELAVHYHSERLGLAPMVIGLMEGIAGMFGESVEVTHRDQRDQGADHDIFVVRLT